jgi:hypothetical protein
MFTKNSLRDEIALHLLPAIYTEYTTERDRNPRLAWDENWRENLVIESYKLADIMIELRNSQTEQHKGEKGVN